jgi:hypothetical protein
MANKKAGMLASSGFQNNALKFRRGKGLVKCIIVSRPGKEINILLHTQFTTFINVRNEINLFPHLSIAFFAICPANLCR